MSSDEQQQTPDERDTTPPRRSDGDLEHHRTATVRKFCEPVEQITGRVVRGFHSSIDTKVSGQAVEVFSLYPQGSEGPSRIASDEG